MNDSWRGAATVARARVRRTVGGCRDLGVAVGEWHAPFATGTFDGVDVVLRPPRLRDATHWRSTKGQGRTRLGTATDELDADHDWAQRWVRLRRLAAARRALPAVIAAPGVGGHIHGEIGVERVDTRIRTGELSGWLSDDLPQAPVLAWALQALARRAFAPPWSLLRLVVPVPITDDSGEHLLRSIGFSREMTARGHRRRDTAFTEYDVFVLHRDIALGDGRPGRHGSSSWD